MRAASRIATATAAAAPIVVQIADKRLERHLVLDPQLALGEGYMQGRLKMVEGRIYDFLELLLSNIQHQPEPGWTQEPRWSPAT